MAGSRTSAMALESCEGCGRTVTIAGGVANIWSMEGDRTEGLTLELADGSEYFLCYDCIERLPEDPTRGDVEALPDVE